MIYPQSRVVRQRRARNQRIKAERRKQELLNLLAENEEHRARLSELTLAVLICMKNTPPNLFDQHKEDAT